MKRVQSERWLSYLKRILESVEADVDSKAATNDETYKRVLSWLAKLLNGEPLSPKQAVNLIETIRKRVPGKAAFSWSDPIQLTKKQIADEKVNNTMDRFTRANRTRAYAAKLMMEAVQEQLDYLNFGDLETMAAFRSHILSFDPEAVVEEEEPVVEEVEIAPNAVMDNIMNLYPRRNITQ